MSIEQTLNDEIDRHIRALILAEAPFVADMAGYFFGWLDEHFAPTTNVMKGKRVRPIIALLTCQAICKDYRPAMPLAVAIELIHNYSLIHDDIADRDEERRGRPTVWKLWGDGLAINTGSVLYTLAFRAIASMNAPPKKVLAIHNIVLQTSIRLSEGQHWDINFEKRLDVTQDMYLRMIDGKTAALLECAAWVGALAATDDEAIVMAYRKFAYHLGLAFQVRDDYLSIWGEPQVTGKPPHSDLRNKKKSLPITYALSQLSGAAHERLSAIYGSDQPMMTDAEIQESLDILDEIQAGRYTATLADHHTGEALGWLDRADIHNMTQEQLRALAIGLLERAT